MMTRQSLYKLIDTLPEGELQAAGRYLQFLTSAIDEESFSPQEKAAMQESWTQMQRGEVTSFDEVVQSLDPGLSLGL